MDRRSSQGVYGVNAAQNRVWKQQQFSASLPSSVEASSANRISKYSGYEAVEGDYYSLKKQLLDLEAENAALRADSDRREVSSLFSISLLNICGIAWILIDI